MQKRAAQSAPFWRGEQSKIPIFQNSNFPKFQFSKKTKETKKTKKTNSAQTMGGRGGEAKSWHNCFFWFFWFLCFFLKIGILENWNFGKLEFWKLPLGEGGVEAE